MMDIQTENLNNMILARHPEFFTRSLKKETLLFAVKILQKPQKGKEKV